VTGASTADAVRASLLLRAVSLATHFSMSFACSRDRFLVSRDHSTRKVYQAQFTIHQHVNTPPLVATQHRNLDLPAEVARSHGGPFDVALEVHGVGVRRAHMAVSLVVAMA
jgi:hypothetical protein